MTTSWGMLSVDSDMLAKLVLGSRHYRSIEDDCNTEIGTWAVAGRSTELERADTLDSGAVAGVREGRGELPEESRGLREKLACERRGDVGEQSTAMMMMKAGRRMWRERVWLGRTDPFLYINRQPVVERLQQSGPVVCPDNLFVLRGSCGCASKAAPGSRGS